MKVINKKELNAISIASNFIQGYVDYYDDVELYEGNNVAEMQDVLNVFNKILSKEDFKPKTKTITKTIEKTTEVYPKDMDDKIAFSIRKGRESVDPLFRYCVFNSQIKGQLFVTDSLEKSMEKAKCLSILEEYSFFEVCSIRKVNDGTYKLFKECYYHNGLYNDGNDEEFLHFDYIRQLFTEIIKL